MSEPPREVVDELYAAPPEEFIARRDARAKELRKEDRAAADAVKKLRRPSVSAAAVNRLARDEEDDVAALLAAGEALRQAQLGGGDRAAIRDAARDEREAVEALVGKAGKLSPATMEEVRQTLHATATNEEVRGLVRRGVLTEARSAAGFGGFPAAAPPPPKRARKPKKDEAAAARKKAEAERKRAARERVKQARAALREAEKTAKTAEREAEAARAEVDRRRDELEALESEA